MREALTTAMRAGAAGLVLLLAACDNNKETGPDVAETAAAPEVAAPVPQAAADPGAVRALIDFNGADANRDGKIASAEYAAATARMFAAMDGDRDGTLTADEMDTASTALQLPTAGMSNRIIIAADNDGDGKLTLAEFIGRSNARFAEMDKNRDGHLDGAEWVIGHPGFGAPAPGAASAPAEAGPPAKATPPAKAAPAAAGKAPPASG